jgi:hypothetical protein
MSIYVNGAELAADGTWAGMEQTHVWGRIKTAVAHSPQFHIIWEIDVSISRVCIRWSHYKNTRGNRLIQLISLDFDRVWADDNCILCYIVLGKTHGQSKFTPIRLPLPAAAWERGRFIETRMGFIDPSVKERDQIADRKNDV